MTLPNVLHLLPSAMHDVTGEASLWTRSSICAFYLVHDSFMGCVQKVKYIVLRSSKAVSETGCMICVQVADDAGLAEYCWIDLSSEVDDVFELARNLGGLAGTNGREPQLHLKVSCARVLYCESMSTLGVSAASTARPPAV